MLLLDTNILIDVLRGQPPALQWLEQQPQTAMSVITWIEALVGCRDGEARHVEPWLESFPRFSLDQGVAKAALALRKQHGLKVPDAIILATATCHGLTLATRNFPLNLGRVMHPYSV